MKADTGMMKAMSESVFREAKPETPTLAPDLAKKEPLAEPGGGVETHIDNLLATYQDDQGKPYTAMYLDIADMWKEEPELKLEVETIEGFLRDEIKKQRLDNSTKAAKLYLKELEKKAGSNPYDSVNQRITKILAYIEFKRVVDGDKKP